MNSLTALALGLLAHAALAAAVVTAYRVLYALFVG